MQVIGPSPYGYVMAPPPPPRRSSASCRSTASWTVSTRAPSAPSLKDLCVVDGATSSSSATTSSAQSEASTGVATSLVSLAAAAQISQDLSAAPSADLPEPPRDASGASASTSGSEGSDFGWGSLTVGILQNIVARLGEGEAKVVRGVSRHWRRVVDHNLESLTPNELQAKVMVARFPNLKTLHLTNCSHIRNRALLIISRAGLCLQTLTLGDDMFKPWVTNEGLACIAEIPTLTSLHLHDCNGVTNNGLLALTKLQSLSTLSLKGCRKLTNGAFEALQGHPALTELNLYGCRLTDKGLMPLMSLNLVSLRLGHTRVRDEGLAYLAQITTLQELHFDQEELSDAGVAQLTSLTRLEFLALRDCGEVSGDSLSVLIPALPNLISLDL
jgi:hypothetical protein